MALPPTPKEQMDRAIDEAWTAAERCGALLEQNNGSSAAYWAQSSLAWSTLAAAVAARLNP